MATLSSPTNIVINWDDFPVDGSVFIPTVDVRATVAYLKRVAATYDYNLRWRQGTHMGLFGVRVWRLEPLSE